MTDDKSETDIKSECRKAAKSYSSTLFNNPRGAYQTQWGGWVTYGVGGDGGHDLIGWRSIIVTPEMIGQRIAIFTSVETKKPGHKTEKKRLENQTDFRDAVLAAGGYSGFAECWQDLKVIFGSEKDWVPRAKRVMGKKQAKAAADKQEVEDRMDQDLPFWMG